MKKKLVDVGGGIMAMEELTEDEQYEYLDNVAITICSLLVLLGNRGFNIVNPTDKDIIKARELVIRTVDIQDIIKCKRLAKTLKRENHTILNK